MRIVNKHKKGFVTTDKKIRIFDKNRKPFYIFDAHKDVTRFNLPKGVFYTKNKISPLKKPVRYRLVLPKRERNIKRPKRIRIKWGNNPNKASIRLKTGQIFIDNIFREDYPAFVPTYLFFHEIGHYFYASEKGADAWARVQMLKRGYNPSQIYMASSLTLSDKSQHRLRACYHAVKDL